MDTESVQSYLEQFYSVFNLVGAPDNSGSLRFLPVEERKAEVHRRANPRAAARHARTVTDLSEVSVPAPAAPAAAPVSDSFESNFGAVAVPRRCGAVASSAQRAEMRAQGTRVMDDVKRLKKAERTRQQQKRKAARAAAERERKVEQTKKKAMKQREKNIADRRKGEIDKILKKKGIKK